MKRYKTTIERILERLGVGTGKRAKEEEEKIKRLVFEAVAKEILGFIYDSLDPLKKLAFRADIEQTKGDVEKINNLISAYYQIIPDHGIRLEEYLKAFETSFYAKLLIQRKNGSSR